MKFRYTLLASRVAAFLAVTAAFPGGFSIAAADTLHYKVTSGSTAGWYYSYRTISRASRVIQPGDVVEYDVYLTTRTPGIGGLDVVNSDGSAWRHDTSWQDQNAKPGHPQADISSQAYRQWFHRALPVPSSAIGKTVSGWLLAADGYYPADSTMGAIYDNIRVTNGGQPVLEIYQSGAPSDNTVVAENMSSVSIYFGPSRTDRQRIGAFFFYWHDAPYNNADASLMVYDPYGLAGNPWVGYGKGYTGGGYYSVVNQYWWESELADLRRAGVDIMALICWGNRNSYFNNASLTNYLVPALERSGSKIKIAMFDDSTSETCEWNVDQGRIYYGEPSMPITDQANWAYFYDRKIRPFFDAIPRKYWATHNGASLEEGGRPMIITYDCGFYTGVNTSGTQLWQWILDRFAADFKDSNGNGIVPWIIFEKSWFSQNAGGIANGEYAWGAATGSGNNFSIDGYRVGNIGPGYDDRLIRGSGRPVTDRQQGARLTRAYNGNMMSDTDLLMVETWNELWEGTSIQRCKDYTAAGGGYLPDTFYIDNLRRSVFSSLGARDLDATFLRTWQIPAVVKLNTPVSVTVRNDGLLPWNPGEVALHARLAHASTGQPIAGTETPLSQLTRTVYNGDEYQFSFVFPTAWPATGSYTLQMDLALNGIWFSTDGVNRHLTKSISFTTSDNASPSRPEAVTANALYKAVKLSWTNASTSDIASTVVRVSVAGYPSSVSSGTFAGQYYNVPSAQESCIVNGLTPGVAHYFSVFSVDHVGNVSPSRTAIATPIGNLSNPSPVASLKAELKRDTTTALISWVNPADEDFSGTEARFSTTGFPQSLSEGSPAFSAVYDAGSVGGFIHENLQPGLTYYYTVWAVDTDGNISAPSHASISSPLLTCGSIKSLADTLPVTLNSAVITALFPDDNSIYIRDGQHGNGIRASVSPAGLSVGDVIDISGAMGTRVISGVNAERVINNARISVKSSGPAPVPLSMSCRMVGGSGFPPFMAGTVNAAGPSNNGNLVRIIGSVTFVVDRYIYVDDGSQVQNVYGQSDPKIGVMIQLPDRSFYIPYGSMVSVTGIVQGNVPVFWTQSRAFMKVRDWNDIVIINP